MTTGTFPQAAKEAARLIFEGELDLATAQDALEAMLTAIAGVPPAVVVDLSRLTHMDSTGINCLLIAQRHAHANGVRLSVVAGTGPPRRVLELTGVGSVVDLIEA